MGSDPQCAKCPTTYCKSAPIEKLKKKTLPNYCPMKSSPKIISKSISLYKKNHNRRIYVPATITEKESYQIVRGTRMPVRPRVKELIEFAKLLKIKKIGMAFCIAMIEEASRLTVFLEKHGFTVASVLCKCGGIDKTILGMAEEDKIRNPKTFEASCNPVLQAELLNKTGAKLNVIVGLCIGHDILFTMNSKAPVTTLIVKDRLLGHNPVAALFSSYYKDIIESQKRI